MTASHRVVTTALTVGLTAASLLVASTARAGCLPLDGKGAALFKPNGATAAFQVAGFGRPGDFDASTIVGLWQFQFVSTITTDLPDGTQINPGDIVDAGYVTWHADGTELMNSGRPPMTSSFCMGVWKQTGRSQYKLNHVALSWDPTGQHLVGPASIKEDIVLSDHGEQYSGHFTTDQFDTNNHLLLHFEGRIAARRIGVE